MLRKGVQTAVCKQFDCKGDFLRLRLVLFEKLCSEILQGRYFTLIVILLIGTVHAGSTAVDNGLLLCAEVAAADELLAQGHNKLGFQDNRIRPVAVLLRHIHSVDVILRSGGNMDYLAAERLNKL